MDLTITISIDEWAKMGIEESAIVSLLRSRIYTAFAEMEDYDKPTYIDDGRIYVRFSVSSISRSLPIPERTAKRKLALLKEKGIVLAKRSETFDNCCIKNEYLYSLTDFSFLESLILSQSSKLAPPRYQIGTSLGIQEKEKKRKEPKEKNNKENIYNNIYNIPDNIKNKKNITSKEVIQEKEKNCDSDESSCDKSQRCAIEEIIDYLNEVTGKKFRTNSQLTKRHLNARLNEDYTVDDFKKVIAYKYEQWGNDKKMREYLRPETLFGTKFEGYLNSVPDDFTPKTKEPEKTAEELEIEKLLEGYQ